MLYIQNANISPSDRMARRKRGEEVFSDEDDI